MPKKLPIRYVLHVQNPHNLNEFDDFESDQPFQPFEVGHVLTRAMLATSGAVAGPINPVRVVAVHRAVVALNDEAYFDETWVVTDEEWHRQHPAF